MACVITLRRALSRSGLRVRIPSLDRNLYKSKIREALFFYIVEIIDIRIVCGFAEYGGGYWKNLAAGDGAVEL
jgi:hypothetical protein